MTNPTELYNLLEFRKIISHMKQLAISELAKEHFDEMVFMRKKQIAERALNEVCELRAVLEQDAPFPLNQYWDIREALAKANIEGNYLNGEALVKIAQTLNTSSRVRSYLQQRKVPYPHLWFHVEKISNLKGTEQEIKRTIDYETFEVKDCASARLAQVRKAISRTQQNARKAIDRLFKAYAHKGYLQDELVTLRDGRLVLPVKLEHKGRVRGLVHDHSASGATLFIEPFESVEINNEIRRLKIEEAREVERILRNLTDLVRTEIDAIRQNLRILSQMDFIQAKARFSQQLGCAKPSLNEDNLLDIQNGRHPLLLLREGGWEKIVPLNLKIGHDFNTLVITGPNAGGKTVALKTVGLFCLMIQSGIPIPAGPDSQIPIFENIFADIGDFQSIEQDLSTFTSHMEKIKKILQHAGGKSLVLVDEIGVGTDPDEGSAIAVAFLEELNQRKALTIVTTHHGALKEFAYETEGVENGSMDFDVETLQPTYRFRVGVPGSSYAIEIAKRSGIAEKLLSRCRELVGVEKGKLESLIFELEKKVLESEKLTAELTIERTRLQGLANLYKERYEALKKKEKSLKEKAIEEAQAILQQTNANVEKAIREIREKQASQEAIKRAKQLIADEKTRIAKAGAELTETEPSPDRTPLKEVQVGAEVYWKKHNSHGIVRSDVDATGKVLIQVDNFKFRVPLAELQDGQERTPPPRRRASIHIETSPKSDLLPEIDLRGQTLEEAITNTDKFLDDAVLAGWNQVRIIHGKGTGVLRKGLTEFLGKHPRVKSKKMGAWHEGDIGVTVVELE